MCINLIKFSFAIKIAINEQNLCCSNRINYKTTDNPNNVAQYLIISHTKVTFHSHRYDQKTNYKLIYIFNRQLNVKSIIYF